MEISEVLRRVEEREAAELARQQKIKMIRVLLADKADATKLIEHFLELHCQKPIGHRRPAIEVSNGSLTLLFGPRLHEDEPLELMFTGGYRITKHGAERYLVTSLAAPERSCTIQKERGQWRIVGKRGFTESRRAQVRTRSHVSVLGIR